MDVDSVFDIHLLDIILLSPRPISTYNRNISTKPLAMETSMLYAYALSILYRHITVDLKCITIAYIPAFHMFLDFRAISFDRRLNVLMSHVRSRD